MAVNSQVVSALVAQMMGTTPSTDSDEDLCFRAKVEVYRQKAKLQVQGVKRAYATKEMKEATYSFVAAKLLERNS